MRSLYALQSPPAWGFTPVPVWGGDYGARMEEREILVTTPDGSMGTFVVHPSDGGNHPLVVFLMDAPGKRELLHSMARRIASHGYYVMLPNLYYRTTDHFVLDWGSEESLQRMSELMYQLGNRMVARDVRSLLDHAAADPRANAHRVGVVGYCMSGPFALWSAAEYAAQVQAVASFYGVRLAVDKSDSPHHRLPEMNAEVYVGAAEFDDWVPLAMVDRFEAALQESGARGRVERYWGKHHGFAFDDRPAYDASADRRHWRELLGLFDRNLH